MIIWVYISPRIVQKPGNLVMVTVWRYTGKISLHIMIKIE
jgi:hypothetical protein